MTDSSHVDLAAKAREESHINLAITITYAEAAMKLLECGDDAGATYTLIRFRENAVAALREFKKVRTITAAPVEMREAAE